MAASLIELTDRWSRALFAAVRGVKQIEIPGEIRVLRPGDEPAEERPRVETDPARIAAFFRKHTQSN